MRQLPFLCLLTGLLGTLALAGQNDTPSVYPYAYQGQWGIVQSDRSVVLPPQIDTIGFFTNNDEHTYALAIDEGAYGLLKADGEWLAKPKYDSIGRMQYYAKHLHWTTRKGKYGLLTTSGKKGKWLVKPKFSAVKDFNGRKVALAEVAIDGKWGVINGEGKLIAPCKYDQVKNLDSYSDYPDYRLTLDGKNYYIDTFGEPLSAKRIKQLEDELEMWGDDVVFEDTSVEWEENLPRFSLLEQASPEGGTDVVLNKNEEEIQRVNVPQEYVVVEKKMLKGYNRTGIAYIMIKQNDKYGFWSSEGRLATPVKYDRIRWQRSTRYDQLAFLVKGENTGLANSQGDLIFPASFKSISEFSYYFRLVHPAGYVGYGTPKGAVFLPQSVNIAD